MYEINQNIFGKNLKILRKSRNLTLDSLGDSINKTKATVSKYEKGEIIPDIATVLEICNVLDISISQLFPMNSKTRKHLSKNPFKTNVIYMYYYTENILITSILEICENNNNIEIKYFNGVKDIVKYANKASYIYEGFMECDKTIGYINLINKNSENTQLEKLQISFNIPWSNNFEITNFYILGLTPNSIPIVKKGILSSSPLNNFDNFKEDLKISKKELIKIQNDNGWILENQNYNHFFFDR